jgi:hypothetical protein
MADASRSEIPARVAVGIAETWRRLNLEQRVAAVGALLLIVSTFGPFSFVEAAIVLVAIGVLVLLRKRAQGHQFHIPFGDGAVIAAAGIWSAVLIVIRLLDRPLGQNLLALVCAAILVLAGLRERAKRPADDVPAEATPPRQRRRERPPPPPERLGPDKVETEALFEPPEWPAPPADKPGEEP